ncbi:gemin 2 [Leptinotarsa decemlineata]|uniref:gemin 2 n=1 Tax=Leptinotarsa decemlineata TaxID=7539 RepID=UPI003D30A6C6
MSDYSSDNDDDCGLLKKAIDVKLPENFDPNSIPQDGFEYLHHVIYERNNCEEWVASNIDTSKFRSNQTYQISLESTGKSIPERFIPSKEWQIRKLDDFKSFKNFVDKQKLPEPSLYVGKFSEEDFKKKLQTETPVFSEFVQYSQAVKIRMLEIISKYLNSLDRGKSIEDNIGTWIFAILVMLEIPLSPSCCYVIRKFTRSCLDIRSELPDDADEKLLNPLNFSICICSRYFRQLDLSD